MLTRPPEPPAPAAVAGQVGLTPARVRTTPKRWNAEGPDVKTDRWAATNGGRHALSEEQQAALFEALQGRPADDGLWTGLKVAAFDRDRWGVALRGETGWKWLRRLGLSRQVRRPRNPAAATADDRRWWQGRPGRADRRAAPLVMLVDNAGWLVARRLEVVLHRLPPCTPVSRRWSRPGPSCVKSWRMRATTNRRRRSGQGLDLPLVATGAGSSRPATRILGGRRASGRNDRGGIGVLPPALSHPTGFSPSSS